MGRVVEVKEGHEMKGKSKGKKPTTRQPMMEAFSTGSLSWLAGEIQNFRKRSSEGKEL